MIVDFHLDCKTVIVIGGGIEGSRKIRGLLGQNCNIVVMTNRLNSHLLHLVEQRKIKIVKTKLDSVNILDNYRNPYLILAATNNKVLLFT